MEYQKELNMTEYTETCPLCGGTMESYYMIDPSSYDETYLYKVSDQSKPFTNFVLICNECGIMKVAKG